MATLNDTLSVEQRDFEHMFIACVIASPQEAVSECAWLSPDVFTNRNLGRFWRDILDHGDAVRALNDNSERIEITKWITRVSSLDRPDDYARKVSEFSYMRSVLSGVQDVVRAVSMREIAEISAKLDKLGESSLTFGIDTPSADRVDEEFRKMISDGVISIPTGIPAIDRKAGGLFPEELLVIAARPGTGKTALIGDMARLIALAERRVLVLSLEMSRRNFWARIVCGDTPYSWEDVRLDKITQDQRYELGERSLDFRDKVRDYLFIEDQAKTLTEMHRVVLNVRPEVIFIDHLGEIHWHNPDDSEVKWFGKATKYIRDYFAQKTGAAVVLVHQLSRALTQRQDKRPVLSDLRWSGEIEQITDSAWMPYREDIYSEDKQLSSNVTKVPMEVWIRKSRYGSMGHINLMYDLRKQRFYAMTDNRLIGTYDPEDEKEEIPF